MNDTPQRRELLALGKKLYDRIQEIDRELAGLRMTPKMFREMRLLALASEREKLLLEYREAKRLFFEADKIDVVEKLTEEMPISA